MNAIKMNIPSGLVLHDSVCQDYANPTKVPLSMLLRIAPHLLRYYFLSYLAILLVKSLHQLTRINPASYRLALCVKSVNNSRIRSS